MSHVLLKWYWSVRTQLKEDVYEGDGGNIQKNIRNVPCTVESSWQVELAAVDLHVINLLGVFTPAF